MAQKKILHCFKRRHCEKTLSRTNSLFTFSAVVVLPSDCILSSLFPAETDVLVPVLSRSTDVVVVNFVVVLKFPNISVKRKSFLCDPARIRTWNPLIRSQMPSPLGPLKHYETTWLLQAGLAPGKVQEIDILYEYYLREMEDISIQT